MTTRVAIFIFLLLAATSVLGHEALRYISRDLYDDYAPVHLRTRQNGYHHHQLREVDADEDGLYLRDTADVYSNNLDAREIIETYLSARAQTEALLYLGKRASTNTVRWDPAAQGFKAQYETQIEQWFNAHSKHTVQTPGGAQTVIDFDEALVMNELHSTTSAADPDPSKHVTVRLSTASLRAGDSWYTLHWRPSGNSVVLPLPENEAARIARRLREKNKKARKKAKNVLKPTGGGVQKKKKGGGGSSSGVAGSSTT